MVPTLLIAYGTEKTLSGHPFSVLRSVSSGTTVIIQAFYNKKVQLSMYESVIEWLNTPIAALLAM